MSRPQGPIRVIEHVASEYRAITGWTEQVIAWGGRKPLPERSGEMSLDLRQVHPTGN